MMKVLTLSYSQEQERQALIAAKRKAWSHSYPPRGDDDDDNNRGPPGSCGSGPGLTTPFNRFVFQSIWLASLLVRLAELYTGDSKENLLRHLFFLSHLLAIMVSFFCQFGTKGSFSVTKKGKMDLFQSSLASFCSKSGSIEALERALCKSLVFWLETGKRERHTVKTALKDVFFCLFFFLFCFVFFFCSGFK